jgi:hypothetical protein
MVRAFSFNERRRANSMNIRYSNAKLARSVSDKVPFLHNPTSIKKSFPERRFSFLATTRLVYQTGTEHRHLFGALSLAGQRHVPEKIFRGTEKESARIGFLRLSTPLLDVRTDEAFKARENQHKKRA